MSEMVFLKLGGSLITDKTQVETVRSEMVAQLADAIATARAAAPDLRVILGHGSGSFGHVAAAKYDTRNGVKDALGWMGFVEVSDAALRLNRIIVSALLKAGVPAIAISPSASAVVHDGTIVQMATASLEHALAAGLIPVIHGDVAFDTVRGGTIISTEEIMSFLAPTFNPRWLLLAGETDGVYDAEKEVIPAITAANFHEVAQLLGGSRGTDVTGGMATKVASMLTLSQQHSGLQMRIFSGLDPANVERLLQRPDQNLGTRIAAV